MTIQRCHAVTLTFELNIEYLSKEEDDCITHVTHSTWRHFNTDWQNSINFLCLHGHICREKSSVGYTYMIILIQVRRAIIDSVKILTNFNSPNMFLLVCGARSVRAYIHSFREQYF